MQQSGRKSKKQKQNYDDYDQQDVENAGSSKKTSRKQKPAPVINSDDYANDQAQDDNQVGADEVRTFIRKMLQKQIF